MFQTLLFGCLYESSFIIGYVLEIDFFNQSYFHHILKTLIYILQQDYLRLSLLVQLLDIILILNQIYKYSIRDLNQLIDCSFLFIVSPLIKFIVDQVFNLSDKSIEVANFLPSKQILDVSNPIYSLIFVGQEGVKDRTQQTLDFFLFPVFTDLILFYDRFEPLDIVLDLLSLSQIIILFPPQQTSHLTLSLLNLRKHLSLLLIQFLQLI